MIAAGDDARVLVIRRSKPNQGLAQGGAGNFVQTTQNGMAGGVPIAVPITIDGISISFLLYSENADVDHMTGEGADAARTNLAFVLLEEFPALTLSSCGCKL